MGVPVNFFLNLTLFISVVFLLADLRRVWLLMVLGLTSLAIVATSPPIDVGGVFWAFWAGMAFLYGLDRTFKARLRSKDPARDGAQALRSLAKWFERADVAPALPAAAAEHAHLLRAMAANLYVPPTPKDPS